MRRTGPSAVYFRAAVAQFVSSSIIRWVIRHHTAGRAAEPPRVLHRVLADDEPVRNFHAVVDDDLVEPDRRPTVT